MSNPARPTGIKPGRTWLPYAALGAGIAVSGLVSLSLWQNVEGEAQLRFERQASEAKHIIEARVRSYSDVLYGVRALFTTNQSVSRAQFNKYVESLDLKRNYPGFEVVNYAAFVPASEKARFEQAVRRDTSLDPRGYPDFAVKPAGERPEYHVMVYLEPMRGNEFAFGLDLGANPGVKDPKALAAAQNQARDSGRLTASGLLIRTRGEKKVVGLAMRLPVYRAGMSLDTLEERRAAYVGSVGAGFDVANLMRGVLNEKMLRSMRYRLYDVGAMSGPAPAGADLHKRVLFDSYELLPADMRASPEKAEGPVLTTVLETEIGGRRWQIQFNSTRAAVIDGWDERLPAIAFVGGLVCSLLLFFALHSLASSRGRAVEIARIITRDLREKEASLASAQSMAHLGNWSLDLATGDMTWSAEAFRILGADPSCAAPDYEQFLQRVHPRDLPGFGEALHEALRTGKDRRLEHRIERADGGMRWVQTIVQPAEDGGRTVARGTMMDITSHKLAALRLQVEHKVTQLIASAEDPAQAIPSVIEAVCTGLGWECGSYWRVEETEDVLRCVSLWGRDAPAVQEFLSLTRKLSTPAGLDLTGRAWASLNAVFVNDVSSEQGFSRAQVAQKADLRQAIALPIVAGGKALGVIELFSTDITPMDAPLRQLLDSLGAQIGQFFQRKAAEDRLRFVATRDPLTQLPNRSMFNERLTHALHQATRYSRSLAVMFIDIDRFKIVNDSLGHGAGDLLLQECARRLTECLRESDIVARFGGDEFAIMIENLTSPRDASAVAQKILARMAAPFSLAGQEFLVSASIGISTCPDDGVDAQTLLKNADVAMYRAKDQGRNNYQFYSASMNKHTFERLAMESSLRRALERGEFQLHYQPKVDLNTGAIAGLEALARWKHPEWGMVPPAQFIPLAEESGLIMQIGEWVLKTACEQSRAWRDEGLAPLRIAVNLSARQFAQKDLLRGIGAIISCAGLAPDCLEIEITESLVMQNPERAARTLQQLKAMGISLAIDDFGTGYSSLAYLKRFPIDCVKIDRSFIKDIPADADDMAITRGVIALAHSLRLKAVAEGVETQEQRDFLVENGCDEMQGYLFSKPLPADQMTALLRKHAQKPSLKVVATRKSA